MSDKVYTKEFLKQGLKKCESTPMPFAFGAGEDDKTHQLVLHPTKIGKSLFADMKKDLGVEAGAWGTARYEAKILVLDCEKNLPGIKKMLKDYQKFNKPLPMDDIKVLVNGMELDSEGKPLPPPPNIPLPPIPNQPPKTGPGAEDLKKLQALNAQAKQVVGQVTTALRLRPDKKEMVDKLFKAFMEALKAQDPGRSEMALHALNNELVDILDSKGVTGKMPVADVDRSAVDDRLKTLVARVPAFRKLPGVDPKPVNDLIVSISTTWVKGPKDQAGVLATTKLLDRLEAELDKGFGKPGADQMDAADKDTYERLLLNVTNENRLARYDHGGLQQEVVGISLLGGQGNYLRAIELLREFIPRMQEFIRTAESLTLRYNTTDAKLFLDADAVPDNPTTHAARQQYRVARGQFDQLVQGKDFIAAGKAYPALITTTKALLRLQARITGQAGALDTNARLMPDPNSLKLGKVALDKLDSDTNRGGVKGHGKYFDAVLKAMRAVEKDTSPKALDALEKAAKAYQQFDADRINEAVRKGRQPEDPDTVTKLKLTTCDKALKMVAQYRAQAKYGAQMNQLTANLPPPPALWPDPVTKKVRELQAKVIAEFPSALGAQAVKPPANKGNSDSFFVNGPDGAPMFIFKPRQGENVKPGEKEGMGVARELLSGEFSKLFSAKTGIDLGFANATYASLDCDGFNDPNLASQATSRSGVLLEAIPNEGSLDDMLKGDPGELANIPDDDVQKIMVMDFITLQGDRNAENVLIQPGEDDEKVLRPIDGGFAFPSPELFEQYRFGMPGSSLTRLPGADKPFTPNMLKAIGKLDPDELVKGMKSANSGLPGELQGLIPDESIEMMKRSLEFLKEAAKKLTPKEVATLYETEFPKVLKAPPKKVAEAVRAAVARGLEYRQFKSVEDQRAKRFEDLGGVAALRNLGYPAPLDPLLAHDLQEKIRILENQALPPPAEPSTPAPALPPANERDAVYQRLGGDKALLEILKRPDVKIPAQFDKATVAVKVRPLLFFAEFQKLGGDAEFTRMVENWEANRYVQFEQLDKMGKVCRAAFAECRFDPAQMPNDDKCKALRLRADRG